MPVRFTAFYILETVTRTRYSYVIMTFLLPPFSFGSEVLTAKHRHSDGDAGLYLVFGDGCVFAEEAVFLYYRIFSIHRPSSN